MALTKRVLVGRPLRSARLGETLLPKRLALPVFCSDPLSSNAYATEEILRAEFGRFGAALHHPLGSVAVMILLAVVVVSYRQTCYAYPNGGGAYAVSQENLGRNAALVAASALLVDYVLTVAVSVAAGVDAITLAFLGLRPYSVELSPPVHRGTCPDESAWGQGVRHGLRHPDVRLHRSNLRHDRLGLLADAYRRCAGCRICILHDRSQPLRRRRRGCADRAESLRPGLHRVDRGRGGQQWSANFSRPNPQTRPILSR